MHVMIIGAGTGGLALAQRLTAAGIEVSVFERDLTRTDGLFGYRVGISPDGSRALHSCLPPPLFETFKRTAAISPRYTNFITEKMGELFVAGGPEDADILGPVDPEFTERSVSRMTLRQILLTGLEDVVRFDKKFERYTQNPDGTVTAYFADGSSATGDVLVGADGTGSRVRKQFLPHAKLVETDLFGVTGKLPLTDEVRALLPPKMLRGVTMAFAPKGISTIFHVMEFEWQRGETDPELVRAWPGLTFDNTRDYVMWGFGSHRRLLPPNFMDMSGPELHRLVLDRTRTWAPVLRRLFLLADATSCFPLNIRTSEPVDPWPSTNITLIGDAIHTMTPGLGVGANTALRDAELLGDNLVRMAALAGIADYERQMHGYAWEAVVKSRERFDGNSIAHKPVIGRLGLAGMRTGMRFANHFRPLKRKILKADARNRDHARQAD
ncbi:FAD-dependent oxidoreductase [Actinocrispum wychmicini]|uniref:2-polyprenyl-6-methoxyphenol hydroxylase-like FAD-dependent oxidoreductase n=1 Tax=Actinocrispum wychmicini TaxID=1213861 RepID=A0A4R2JZ02_9PSEU|nr:NAD(P)/FAD-dependent oxidoreductase [Actinocrispum wychmicini]TCO65174.1 2-polyprenyl-6-methoxyphenol hydroxylase-like FAD-dependent oxidoreductase [Actinocrispum wychmicini]